MSIETYQLVSIIVPIYKIEAYLPTCIESLINQTYPTLEIILVDDGSPDQCPAICDSYATLDTRIHVIHKPNGGLVSARKAGLAASHGAYISNVDGDDWVEPTFIERMVEEAQRADVDIVATGFQRDLLDSTTSMLNTLPCGIYRDADMRETVYLSMLYSGAFFRVGVYSYLWNKLFRREILFESQMKVDNRIFIGEDAACVYPTLLQANSLCITDDCLYHYRQRNDSMLKRTDTFPLEIENLRLLYEHLEHAFLREECRETLITQLQLFLLSLVTIRSGGLILRKDGSPLYFPFTRIRKGDNVVVYSTGTFGQHLYRKLRDSGYCNVVGWVDVDHKQSREQGIPADAPLVIGSIPHDRLLVAAVDTISSKSVRQKLISLGEPAEKICSFDFALNCTDRLLKELGICRSTRKTEGKGEPSNMGQEFLGKRLLILGDNPETAALVEVANDMGVYTIVVGMTAHAKAKAIASTSYDVDGLDVQKVIAIAKAEKADGVLVGVADILVPSYCAVCDALGLPCYATKEIVDVFAYKDTFKRKCEEYGILGIPEYRLDTRMLPEDIARIRYPVMVKPVDNGGGVGMTVCYEESELAAAVQTALDNSKSKKFIVEKYMTCSDMGIYYTFKDGECFASCVYDRYTSSEQPGMSRVCLGGTYPSRYIDVYFSNMHEKACRMFHDIGIQNGVLMLSAFYENGSFYVYDTGFRLQGEAPHLLIKQINGFDQREMLIRFALTGCEGADDLHVMDDPYLRGKYAATQWFLLKEGTIGEIQGLAEAAADPNVTYNMQRLYVGDTVSKQMIGNEKQVLTRLYLVCDTKRALAEKLKQLDTNIKVYDQAGYSMRLHGFNPNNALFGEEKSLQNKVIVISGGTKGIGASLAVECARRGADVVFGGRDDAAAENVLRLMKNVGHVGVYVHTDLHYMEDCKKLFDTAVSRYGRVDGFVNYAGVTPVAGLTDCKEETFDDVLTVDFKAAFFCCQHAINLMRKNPNGGSIVLCGSAHSWNGQKNRAAYACAKGALYTLSEHIAHNYAVEGIRCNYLTLGWSPTEGELELKRAQGVNEAELRKEAANILPLGRMIEAEDEVPGIIYLLSDHSAMVAGANIRITGGEYI